MTTKRVLGRAIVATWMCGWLTSCGGGKPVDVIFTLTGNDAMQYSQKMFETTAPANVTVHFKNVGKMPKQSMGHNFVLLKAGRNPLEFAGKCLSEGAKAENEFLPESLRGDVLAYTKILGPDEEETLVVKLDKPGTYSYVCTFTGHGAIMRGEIVVK